MHPAAAGKDSVSIGVQSVQRATAAMTGLSNTATKAHYVGVKLLHKRSEGLSVSPLLVLYQLLGGIDIVCDLQDNRILSDVRSLYFRAEATACRQLWAQLAA